MSNSPVSHLSRSYKNTRWSSASYHMGVKKKGGSVQKIQIIKVNSGRHKRSTTPLKARSRFEINRSRFLQKLHSPPSLLSGMDSRSPSPRSFGFREWRSENRAGEMDSNPKRAQSGCARLTDSIHESDSWTRFIDSIIILIRRLDSQRRMANSILKFASWIRFMN